MDSVTYFATEWNLCLSLQTMVHPVFTVLQCVCRNGLPFISLLLLLNLGSSVWSFKFLWKSRSQPLSDSALPLLPALLAWRGRPAPRMDSLGVFVYTLLLLMLVCWCSITFWVLPWEEIYIIIYCSNSWNSGSLGWESCYSAFSVSHVLLVKFPNLSPHTFQPPVRRDKMFLDLAVRAGSWRAVGSRNLIIVKSPFLPAHREDTRSAASHGFPASAEILGGSQGFCTQGLS